MLTKKDELVRRNMGKLDVLLRDRNAIGRVSIATQCKMHRNNIELLNNSIVHMNSAARKRAQETIKNLEKEIERLARL